MGIFYSTVQAQQRRLAAVARGGGGVHEKLSAISIQAARCAVVGGVSNGTGDIQLP